MFLKHFTRSRFPGCSAGTAALVLPAWPRTTLPSPSTPNTVRAGTLCASFTGLLWSWVCLKISHTQIKSITKKINSLPDHIQREKLSLQLKLWAPLSCLNSRSINCCSRSSWTVGFCSGSLSDPPCTRNLCRHCFMELCEWIQVYRISTVAALGIAARNSTIKTDHLSKDGKTCGPLRVHWIIAVISVTTERNALQGKTWLQNLAYCSYPAAQRGCLWACRCSAAEGRAISTSWLGEKA